MDREEHDRRNLMFARSLSTEDLLNRLEEFGFECEHGLLATCPEWIALKQRIAQMQTDLSEYFKLISIQCEE